MRQQTWCRALPTREMELESDKGQLLGPGAESPQTREMTLESDGFEALTVCLEMWAVWCPLPVGRLIALF